MQLERNFHRQQSCISCGRLRFILSFIPASIKQAEHDANNRASEKSRYGLAQKQRVDQLRIYGLDERRLPERAKRGNNFQRENQLGITEVPNKMSYGEIIKQRSEKREQFIFRFRLDFDFFRKNQNEDLCQYYYQSASFYK
jgi:hypothetical protein